MLVFSHFKLTAEAFPRCRVVTSTETTGRDVDQFVVQAALKEAHAVLERERFVRLSCRDAEAFFKALENPPAPNKRLKKAVAAYRRSALNALD
ncbi:MAG: DUF1778 domain-containing protein [Sulfuricaulis sp.]|nr:DUF1778 domain-containing protein [Sulfuricaulis sp.]